MNPMYKLSISKESLLTDSVSTVSIVFSTYSEAYAALEALSVGYSSYAEIIYILTDVNGDILVERHIASKK
jgi:hypothetical protein